MKEIRPSKLFYLIPMLTLIIGITVFIFLIIKTVKDTVHSNTYFKAGDTLTVEVLEENRYYILVENVSREDTEFFQLGNFNYTMLFNYFNTPIYSDIKIYKEDQPNQFVTINELSSNQNVTINSYDAFLYVEFQEPGNYVIQTTNTIDSSLQPTINLAISNLDIFHLIGFIFVAIIILFVSIILSIVTFIIIITKRSKQKSLIAKEFHNLP